MLDFLRKYLFINPYVPDANLPKRTNFFDQIILVGKLSSVLHPLDNAGFWTKVFYFIFIVISDSLIAITGFQFVIKCIEGFKGDFNKNMPNVINVPVYVLGAFFLLYYQYRSDFLKMMFRFACKNFRYRSARGLTVFTTAPVIRVNKIFVPFLVFSTFLGAYQWLVNATISTLNGKKELPLEVDYLIDGHATPYFEVLFGLQVYMQAIIGFHYSNMTALFIVFSTLVTAQLDILRCSIKNTGHTALLRLGVPHAALVRTPGFKSCADAYFFGSEKVLDCCYDQIGNKVYLIDRERKSCSDHSNLNQEFVDKKLTEAIKDCVEHHEVIRTFCKYMEDFFRIPLAVNLFGSCITICFTLYSNADSFELKTVSYLSLSSVMTLMICYMGNQIYLQSELLDLAVYWSGWEHQSVHVRKYYLILMQQSARPVLLTGGGLVRLTLENFLAIMRMSFSFYTLMRNTIHNNE